MNTANLQLEGLYVAVAAILNAIREKGLLTEQEIERALAGAEQVALGDRSQLSPAHVDGICFPLRLLRLANKAGAQGQQRSFSELATRVGQTKPEH
jgi:hypothetical protein